MSRASLGSSKRHSASSSSSTSAASASTSASQSPSPSPAYEDARMSTNSRTHLEGEGDGEGDVGGEAEAEAETEAETATVHGSSTANSSPNPSWKPRAHRSHSHLHPHSTLPLTHQKSPLSSSSSSSSPSSSAQPASPPAPFSSTFWSPAAARARAAYFRLYAPGVVYITFIILAVLSVFWGTLFKLPDRPLRGVVVDFDGGPIAASLTSTIQSVEASLPTRPIVSWTYIPLSASLSLYPNGIDDVRKAIEQQEMFVAVAVAPGASARLLDAVRNPQQGYNGTGAVVAFGSEGRNENAYRTYLFPHLINTLNTFQHTFALQFAAQQTANLTAESLQRLMQVAPQTLVLPAGFTIVNVFPFYQPIATAPVFTGLIFVLILAFFTVLVANGARVGSGLNRLLTLRSLIALRFGSAAAIYGYFSLLYSLLNLMFGVRLTHTFGHAGFVLFWLGTWIYMLGVGLVLESWVILFKANTPFFFFPWLVVNLSVGVYPLEMLPKFYHYGYGAPYYNMTRVVRTIVFGTRNSLGLNFGVLLAWVLVGTLNMTAVQWYVRRQDIMALRKASAAQAAPATANAPSDPEKAQMKAGMETAGAKA